MKRIISLALVALLAVALFAGCGNKDGGSAKNVDLNAVLDTINSENNLSLDKVTDIAMVKRYYNVAEEDVKQFAVESDKSNPNAPVEMKQARGAQRAMSSCWSTGMSFSVIGSAPYLIRLPHTQWYS